MRPAPGSLLRLTYLIVRVSFAHNVVASESHESVDFAIAVVCHAGALWSIVHPDPRAERTGCADRKRTVVHGRDVSADRDLATADAGVSDVRTSRGAAHDQRRIHLGGRVARRFRRRSHRPCGWIDGR